MTTQPELPIDSIIVGERHRKDPGDIKALADSIDTIGLIHPVVVKPDNTLIAGQRRLLALRQLGWDSVPVTVIHTLNGAVDELLAERDENTCRKPMTAPEMATLGAELEKLEREDAEQRQHEGQDRGRKSQSRGGGGRFTGLATTDAKPADQRERGPRTAEAVGKALGISGRQYERIRDVHRTATGQTDDTPEVVEVAQEALEQMGEGEATVWNASERVRSARKGQDPAPQYKGKAHQKRQVRSLESVMVQLSAMASSLALVFDGGFEKTCSPAVAAEYARLIRVSLKEINKVVSRLEQHGKVEECSVA